MKKSDGKLGDFGDNKLAGFFLEAFECENLKNNSSYKNQISNGQNFFKKK